MHISFNQKKLVQLLFQAVVVLSLVFLKGGVAYADLAPDEVVFFTDKNYAGQEHLYTKGDPVDIQKTPSLNDKFQSVKLSSSDIKVLAWRDYNFQGPFREYRIDNPDITDLGGLSAFHIVSNDLSPSFKFVDETNSPDQYCLKLQAYQYGLVTDCSKDDFDDFQVIGTLDKNRPEPLNTAVYLYLNESALAIGSVYFRYNSDFKGVEIAEELGQLPEGLTYEAVGNDKFIFKWTNI